MLTTATTARTTHPISEQESSLSVAGVTVQRQGITTLEPSDFTLRSGTITAVIGPNGAGKSTMIGAVLGLIPAAGTMFVQGRPRTFGSTTPAEIGCVLDRPLWHTSETALDFVRAMAQPQYRNDNDVHAVLERVGAHGFRHRRMARMSLGMRQRVALAGALINRPPIILMDEPTNGLDPVALLWLRRALVEMAQEGTTILVSSHDLLPMTQIADDVLVVNRARIIHNGSMASMLGETDSGGVRPRHVRATREVIVDANDVDQLDALLTDLGAEFRPGFDGERWTRGVHWEDLRDEADRRNLRLSRLGVTTESLHDPVALFARLIDEDNA